MNLPAPDWLEKILPLAAEADFIVTGDKKHLLPLREFQGVQIISAVEFLKRLAVK